MKIYAAVTFKTNAGGTRTARLEITSLNFDPLFHGWDVRGYEVTTKGDRREKYNASGLTMFYFVLGRSDITRIESLVMNNHYCELETVIKEKNEEE